MKAISPAWVAVGLTIAIQGTLAVYGIAVMHTRAEYTEAQLEKLAETVRENESTMNKIQLQLARVDGSIGALVSALNGGKEKKP